MELRMALSLHLGEVVDENREYMMPKIERKEENA
jgi:hypothetical protein